MACFLVPVAEAIAVTVAKKVVEKKEKNNIKMNGLPIGEAAAEVPEEKKRFTWTRKLGWLEKMLWGGSFLLLIEHIWHGEVVPWPPFLTAMTDPAATSMMLNEIATVGTAMAVFVTAVWGLMALIAGRKEKLALKSAKAED